MKLKSWKSFILKSKIDYINGFKLIFYKVAKYVYIEGNRGVTSDEDRFV